MVKEIKTVDEFKEAITVQNLVVIDFWADWCGPCKAIAPKYAKLSESHTNVDFYKLNVDEGNLEEVCNACKISNLPSFCFFKNGKYLTKVIGANIDEINKAIKQYGQESSSQAR